ncbi:hypothetical protein C3941_09615 [Kaistia algarum]|uniref:ADYC domain-containing protein n=1 Tax=Kaistia algarum TaxID=2083279 RepID=UPI000CE85547|nr:ADYC domain-containing protein [Kaistia algarum]MCX5512313.1 ADYC domain-containing protein [Kaistia algarum]PPE80404.1 hypothetical protein C3941_09615 [Kaistia algarum]
MMKAAPSFIAAAAIGLTLGCLSVAPLRAEPTIRSVGIEGTKFVVTLSDGRTLGSPDLVGAVLSVDNGAAGAERIRIASVAEIATPSGPILLHDLEIEKNGSWQPACEPDPRGRRLGFPISGRSTGKGSFDPAASGFEIACTSGAFGKCLLFGYHPWKNSASVPMERLYRSCIRMVRADYCGDGRSWTRNGMTIDIFDRFGVQKADNPPNMTLEAAWSPNGAVCIHHARVPSVGTLDAILEACPRLAARAATPCDVNAEADLFDNSVDTPDAAPSPAP